MPDLGSSSWIDALHGTRGRFAGEKFAVPDGGVPASHRGTIVALTRRNVSMGRGAIRVVQIHFPRGRTGMNNIADDVALALSLADEAESMTMPCSPPWISSQKRGWRTRR